MTIPTDNGGDLALPTGLGAMGGGRLTQEPTLRVSPKPPNPDRLSRLRIRHAARKLEELTLRRSHTKRPTVMDDNPDGQRQRLSSPNWAHAQWVVDGRLKSPPEGES